MTDDNNLFDDDDALDYILYEEANKETTDGGKGCFGVVLLLMRIPAESGHRSGGKKAGIPLGKRPPFRSNPASKK